MSRLLERLQAKTGIVFAKNSNFARALWRGGVSDSDELRRIHALPRRTLDLENTPDLTPLFQRPGGTMRLWPIQSAALLEMEAAGGLLAPIGVGHGKTLISLLAGEALGAKRVLILVPAALKSQLREQDIPRLGNHFTLPDVDIASYHDLSSPQAINYLSAWSPDLIVADEAHHLRHKDTARTRRFLDFMETHPNCKLVALSGTMTNRSLKDYAHLAHLALRQGSPLPQRYQDLEEWSCAIDVPSLGPPMPAGALEILCDPGESVRSGFRRRLVDTRGVVTTAEGSVGTSLVLSARTPEVPREIKEALDRLRTTWEVGGEELTDAFEFYRAARQLALGFYYKWNWPYGVVDHEWLEARADWRREVRAVLKGRYPGLDSPALVELAYHEGSRWSVNYDRWMAVKRRPAPPTVPVWLTKSVIKDAIAWGRVSETPSIIWFTNSAVGVALADMNIATYPAGADEVLLETKFPLIACSVQAHGTGKNLQRYSRNLLLGSLSNGTAFEQLIGRTHRPGQTADEVTLEIYQHTPELVEAWEAALDDAKYMQETTGTKQKIIYATKIGLKAS